MRLLIPLLVLFAVPVAAGVPLADPEVAWLSPGRMQDLEVSLSFEGLGVDSFTVDSQADSLVVESVNANRGWQQSSHGTFGGGEGGECLLLLSVSSTAGVVDGGQLRFAFFSGEQQVGEAVVSVRVDSTPPEGPMRLRLVGSDDGPVAIWDEASEPQSMVRYFTALVVDRDYVVTIRDNVTVQRLQALAQGDDGVFFHVRPWSGGGWGVQEMVFVEPVRVAVVLPVSPLGVTMMVGVVLLGVVATRRVRAAVLLKRRRAPAREELEDG